MVFEDSAIILFITMFLLTSLALLTTKFDILHPFVVFCITMTSSALLTVIMKHQWQLHVSSFATIIWSTSIIVFGLGALWSELCLHKYTIISKNNSTNNLEISYKIMILMLILMSLCVIFNFKETYEASIRLGNTQGIFNMIRTVRLATEKGVDVHLSRWMSYRTLFTASFTYICILIYFQNVFLAKKSIIKNGIYLTPIIFYIPILILSGGRMGLLNLSIYILIVGAVLYEKRNNFSQKSKIKVIVACVAAGILFLMLFLVFGFFTGKVSLHGRGPFDIIAHYGGLSAPALSIYLNSISLETPYIGLTTLWDIYKKISILGLDLPKSVTFLNFVHFNGVTTNVYTAMRRYIEDYGFLGMYMIMFFLGMLYTSIYKYVKFISRSNITLAFYASIALPLFFSINDDIFFSHVIRTTTVYQFIVMFAFYKLIMAYSSKEKN